MARDIGNGEQSMKNQIPEYGKSIRSYCEAEPQDGLLDITEAFQKALDDKENTLLTLPAGNFILRKRLCLRSDLFIDAHPHAEIEFCGLDGEDGVRSLHIRGGLWRLLGRTDGTSAFEFSNGAHLLLENMKLDIGTGIGFVLAGGKDIRIERCTLFACSTEYDVSTGILVAGTLEKVRIGALTARGCGMCMEISPESVLKNTVLYGLDGEDCQYLIYAIRASLDEMLLEHLCGCAHTAAIHLEDCTVGSLNVRDAELHNGFFEFVGNRTEHVRIERFRRRYDLDKNAATHPSFRISGETCLLRADVVSLDSILRTQKLCPSVKLNVARRSYPLLQPDMPFVYAYEAFLSSTDSYIMPSGSFECLDITPLMSGKPSRKD